MDDTFRKEHLIVPVAEGAAGAVSFTSSGQLLPNTEIRIVSEFPAQRDPSNHVGEILVKSDCLFAGYYNRPDLTAQARLSMAGTTPAILVFTSKANFMLSAGRRTC